MEFEKLLSMMKSTTDGEKNASGQTSGLSKINKSTPKQEKNQDLQEKLETLLDGLEQVDPEMFSQLVAAIQKRGTDSHREPAATSNKDTNNQKTKSSIEEQIAKHIRSGM